MTQLVKLINQGNYREAITVAYGGRYGDREFAPMFSGAGGPCDAVGRQTALGPRYNVERAVGLLSEPHRAWLLWCYTDFLQFDRSAFNALASEVNEVEHSQLSGLVDYGRACSLLLLLMDNFKCERANGRSAHTVESMARVMGFTGRDGRTNTGMLRGSKLWGRVRRGVVCGMESLDKSALDSLALRLESFESERAA